MVKIILASSILGMLMLSGCSSDTKESLNQEMAKLIMDCGAGKFTKGECREKADDIRVRFSELEK